jgi:tyrosyl-tRNA synthetase
MNIVFENFNLATRNTEEIILLEELKTYLEKGKFNFYYGTAPTGSFHIGYLVPIGKCIDLLKCKGNGTILIADYHAYLDDRKTSWEEMETKSKYYEICIKAVLGKYKNKIKFVRGSEFQTGKKYIEDVFKLTALVTVKRALRAASEVCRLKNPKVSELVYPIMQCLDVKYLKIDVAIGGIDQRHIYVLARETLEEVNWKKPTCIFTPLLTSLKDPRAKMSASIRESHIKVHDDVNTIKNLILSAYCPEKIIKGNPITDICHYIIFPFMGKLKIERKKKYGGEIEYSSWQEFKQDYENGRIHPKDLKESVITTLNQLLEPVRKSLIKHKELLSLANS